MPIFVIRTKNNMPVIELIWYKDEWCQQIPEAWRRHCGCQRCCDIEIVKQFVKEKVVKELLDSGTVAWFKNLGTNHWWFLRYYKRGDKVCLAPWPKRLVNSLSKYFGG